MRLFFSVYTQFYSSSFHSFSSTPLSIWSCSNLVETSTRLLTDSSSPLSAFFAISRLAFVCKAPPAEPCAAAVAADEVAAAAAEVGAEKFDARSCCLLGLLLLLEPDNASIPSGHRLTNGACFRLPWIHS